MSELRTGVLEEAEALERLAPGWRGLWLACTSATPFQSPAWLLPWWRAFHPGGLRVAYVFDGARLVALAPFYCEESAEESRLLPLGVSLSDYLDVLIEDDQPPAILSLLMKGLFDGCSRCDCEDLGSWALALRLWPQEGWTQETFGQNASPILGLSGSDWDEHVPARKRRQVRRALRAAQRRGNTKFTRVGSELDCFFDDLLRLHEQRWRSQGQEGVLTDPRARQFQRAAVHSLSREGVTRLYTVEIAERLAGAYYGFLHGGRAYAYLGGFDPTFSEESPGSLLLAHAIAEAKREGATEFHFLRGAEKYKYDWGAKEQWTTKRIFRKIG